MPETFTWSPQKGYSVERTPNVAAVKLGDGYEQRQVKVPFLGGVARLPAAPFILAQLSGRPLFVFFAFRVGANRYHVPLSAPIQVDKGPRQGRQQAIAAAAGRYAALLEEAVRRHPDQWYHFDRFVH